MYTSLSLQLKKSCFKVTVCIYHPVFFSRKDVLRLRYVYIIECSSQENFLLKLRYVYIIECSSQEKLI